MIKIPGIADIQSTINSYAEGSIEKKIAAALNKSEEVYNYKSIEEIKFEIEMRINIINAARSLFRSRMSFRIFRQTICNEVYWKRTLDGGFEINKQVKASDGIRDIYKNGFKYGTECATAIVIVYYKALLDNYPEELFNQVFPKIKLMDWHYDMDLGINSYRSQSDNIPGDCRYFKNPQVSLKALQWQGENAIDLGDGTYYGHGIGLQDADNIIKALNRNRRRGATKEAYLMDSATRPDFRHLFLKLEKHNVAEAR